MASDAKTAESNTLNYGALSEPSAVILDPYMGSGTTGVAVLQMDRQFIGIEVEECSFAAAERRIERKLAQGRLF